MEGLQVRYHSVFPCFSAFWAGVLVDHLIKHSQEKELETHRSSCENACGGVMK